MTPTQRPAGAADTAALDALAREPGTSSIGAMPLVVALMGFAFAGSIVLEMLAAAFR